MYIGVYFKLGRFILVYSCVFCALIAPVQFDSCGGEYCTEEIDVSSLHAKNVSSVFLSSSFTYDMNSPVKEKVIYLRTSTYISILVYCKISVI
jgi:hypothetical protein